MRHCDLKIKVFYSICNIMWPIKRWCEIAAISRYCLIVLLWIAFSENTITSYWPVLKFRYLFGSSKMIWPMAPNLRFCSQICFQCLFGFFYWRSEVVGFKCVALI